MYYLPVTALGTGNTDLNETITVLVPLGIQDSVEEDTEQILQV